VGVGACAVDDSGLPLPLTKMKVSDLRAECAARGVEGTEDMKRADLMELVKVGGGGRGGWGGGGEIGGGRRGGKHDSNDTWMAAQHRSSPIPNGPAIVRAAATPPLSVTTLPP
jgi:hypothetical protein